MNIIKIKNLSLCLEKNNYSKDELLEMYWLFHPRFRFVKSVRGGSKLLDVGAGPGGMIYWKDWLKPHRNDTVYYATDLEKGDLFDKYEDYQICNLDTDKLDFKEKFDAFMLSHVLEHIKDPNILLKKLSSSSSPGAMIYIETPTPLTENLVSRNEFLKKDVNVSTINFFDDPSHLKPYGLEEISVLLNRNNFMTLEQGIIQNEYLGPLLFGYGQENKDSELTTYGAWLQLNWCHYIVAKRY